jgi:hypothetical protein
MDEPWDPDSAPNRPAYLAWLAAKEQAQPASMTELINDAALDALPLPAEPWRYGRRFLDALVVAAAIHAAQPRKGSEVPYASHVLGACSIALDYGATEEEAIAALLHDVIEDVVPADAARAGVAAFGPEVLRIVEGCTKAELDDGADSFEAKMAYAARFAEADASILLVAASDKLHNARSIVADLRRSGDAVFSRFSVSPAETLTYYRALVSTFQANPASNPDLVGELDRVVTEMEGLATTRRCHMIWHATRGTMSPAPRTCHLSRAPESPGSMTAQQPTEALTSTRCSCRVR